MSYYRDPYTNTQMRFERTDRTGRYQSVCSKKTRSSAWGEVLLGLAIGFALMGALAVSL